MHNKRRNYLSIDGGFTGITALCSLIDLFKRLKTRLGLTEDPLPCQWFGLMVGTGTGAIVVLLLGKLQLTPSRALKAYEALARFIPVKPIQSEEERKVITDAFTRVFTEVLEDAGLPPDAPMNSRSENGEITKTAVLCMTEKAGLEYCHFIRSYGVRGISPTNCTILQAACACIASSNGILPIVANSPINPSLLHNAMAEYANPVKPLIQELELVFGESANVGTILSIGSNSLDSDSIFTETETKGADIYDLEHCGQTCQSIRKDTAIRQACFPGYFRLNADARSPLQDSLTAGWPEAQLESILVSMLQESSETKNRDLRFLTVIEPTFKPRPTVDSHFTGYTDIFNSLHNGHFGEPVQDRHSPRVSVLTGPDGAGKMQLALKFALEYEAFSIDSPIFLLDAQSETRLELALREAISSRDPFYEGRSLDSCMRWLSRKQKDWLLIFQNAQTNLLNSLFSYVPQSNRGHVLITTSHKTYSALAPDSSFRLNGLDKDDAITSLLSISMSKVTHETTAHAEKIVARLENLPGPLAFAARYIHKYGDLAGYLQLYEERQNQLLANVKSPEFNLSFTTAIQICLDSLPQRSRDLIQLLCAFDNLSIPHDMIKMAAERRFCYHAFKAEDHSVVEMMDQAKCLGDILCPNGEWIEHDFDQLTLPCIDLALLQVSRRRTSKFYTIHKTVRAWIIEHLGNVGRYDPQQLAVRILVSCITFGESDEHLTYLHPLLPHIREVQKREIIAAPDLYVLAMVLHRSWDAKEASSYFEYCLQRQKDILEETHPHRLRTMAYLASALFDDHRPEKGLELKQKAWELQKEVLGETNRETLSTLISISSLYFKMERIEEAKKLQEEVLDLQQSCLEDNDLDLLATKGRLAASYSKLGDEKTALALRKQIYKKQKKEQGKNHPDTLRTRLNIAHSLSMLARHDEAYKLRNEVLAVQEDLYGEEHLDTLKTLSGIATSLVAQAKYKDARQLRSKVYRVQKKVLGEEHRDTLLTMGCLAIVFSKLKNHRNALELREKTLKLQIHTLGENDSQTLRTRIGIASSLSALKRHEEAVEEGQKVLAGQKLCYQRDDHPDILRTLSSIASFLFTWGKQEEALKIKLGVLEKQKVVLGKRHRDTLSTMENIRDFYTKMGNSGDAWRMKCEIEHLR